MKNLNRKWVIFFIFISNHVFSQQFVGLSMNNYAAIQMVSQNPAWVANNNNIDIHLGSFSALIGNNAFKFNNDNLFKNGISHFSEGSDYAKILTDNKKYLWGNLDILGPSFSIRIKKVWNIGLTTRIREIVNAGNIDKNALTSIGMQSKLQDTLKMNFNKAGFSVHGFQEIGLVVGKELINDGINTFRAGASLKILTGKTAASVFTNATTLIKEDSLHIRQLTGDLSLRYAKNSNNLIDGDATNDIGSLFTTNGNNSVGLDIGIQYERHPDPDINGNQRPYIYTFAASITDIGAISYKAADSGNANFQLNYKDKYNWFYDKLPYEENIAYLNRMIKDSAILRNAKIDKFTIGLPTAFRMQFDWNAKDNFYVSTSCLLNLRASSSTIYKSGYNSYFQITPRYEKKGIMIGLPFAYFGRQTFTAGLVFRLGPLFFGSSSIITAAMKQSQTGIDAYAGLSFHLKKRKPYADSQTYNFN